MSAGFIELDSIDIRPEAPPARKLEDVLRTANAARTRRLTKSVRVFRSFSPTNKQPTREKWEKIRRRARAPERAHVCEARVTQDGRLKARQEIRDVGRASRLAAHANRYARDTQTPEGVPIVYATSVVVATPVEEDDACARKLAAEKARASSPERLSSYDDRSYETSTGGGYQIPDYECEEYKTSEYSCAEYKSVYDS